MQHIWQLAPMEHQLLIENPLLDIQQLEAFASLLMWALPVIVVCLNWLQKHMLWLHL